MDLACVNNVARANPLAAKSALTDEVVNVVTGQEMSSLDLAEVLGGVIGVERSRSMGRRKR